MWIKDIDHGSAEWHSARKGKINISTAVNILYPGQKGVRGTPYTEYLRIVSELDGTDTPEELSDDMKELFAWGSNSEELHFKMLEDEVDGVMAMNKKMLQHDAMPYLVGTPDIVGSHYDGNFIVEMKAPIYHDPWGDECPIGPQTQCRLYMMIADCDFGYVSALIPPGLRLYRLSRDRQWWEGWATNMLRMFWEEHIEKRVPPSMNYEKDVEAAKSMARQAGKTVDLSDELLPYADMMAKGKEMVSEGEDMERMGRVKILEALGDAETGRFKDGSGFSFLEQTRKLPAREESVSKFRVLKQLKPSSK